MLYWLATCIMTNTPIPIHILTLHHLPRKQHHCLTAGDVGTSRISELRDTGKRKIEIQASCDQLCCLGLTLLAYNLVHIELKYINNHRMSSTINT